MNSVIIELLFSYIIIIISNYEFVAHMDELKLNSFECLRLMRAPNALKRISSLALNHSTNDRAEK